MRRVCLALPTNRACAETIAAVHEEAAYGAAAFDVEVHLLILDSSAAQTHAAHRRAVSGLARAANVVVHLLDEPAQRAFLREAIRVCGLPGADLLLDLMLPDGLSYGACTNRAFLVAAALGCESVHRRDSDSHYQSIDGRLVFPIHHELAGLGKRAGDVAGAVTDSTLGGSDADKTVVLAGASFVGELSVDLGEIAQLDAEVYRELVSLWAPISWSDEQKRELAGESFRGAGTEPFTEDRATLCVVDPMRIDMCNIAFHAQTFERVPLPPARDTIGSDYFLMHAIHSAGLPGVLHNRHIVNYYTPERRTDAGFAAYHLRFAKFLLSMLYLNSLYERMDEAGAALLDEHGLLRSEAIAALAQNSAQLDTAENRWRLDIIERCYRKLGGRYDALAETVAARRERLLDQARTDIGQFALLTAAWPALVRGGRAAAWSLPRPGSVV